MTKRNQDKAGWATPPPQGPSSYFKATSISRSTGANAVERAACRHATQMSLYGTVSTKDYRDRAPGLQASGLMLPDDAPSWAAMAYGEPAFRSELFQAALTLFQDDEVTLFIDEGGLARCKPQAGERMATACLSERIWTDIEQAETIMNRKRSCAQLANEIVAALPRVLSIAAQTDIVRGFAQEAFTSRGLVVDWTLHDRGGGNPHVVMMIPTRFLGADTWGEKHRRLNHRREFRPLRETWGQTCNLVLAREGRRERVDMRSYEDQGILLEPESHDRRIAAHADRAGVPARERDRCDGKRRSNQRLLRENPAHIIKVVQQIRASFTKSELLAALADRLDLTPETLHPELAAKVTDSPGLAPTCERTPDGEALFVARARAECERSRE